MRAETRPFGEIEIDERQIVEFPQGIIGFEQFTRYALLDAAQKPFYWLQCLDAPEIAFVLLDPTVFRPAYTPDVPPEDTGALGLEAPEDLIVFAIVTIPENQNRMTANLQGPILINRKTRTGRQAVSVNPQWKLRHSVMEELAALKGEPC